MKSNKNASPRKASHQNPVVDTLRQLMQPPEFRIADSAAPSDLETPADSVSEPDVAAVPALEPISGLTVSAFAEVATSLWYMKTKFFKHAWDDDSGSEEDPRVRRALGRINKGVDALRAAGVEIDDRTNKRYPQGGANLMRPIELLPTDGITHEMVTETITPIVFFQGKLVQPGEVFVAVPLIQATASLAQSDLSDTSSVIVRGVEQTDGNEEPASPADAPPATGIRNDMSDVGHALASNELSAIANHQDGKD